jgi:hypothetical protein
VTASDGGPGDASVAAGDARGAVDARGAAEAHALVAGLVPLATIVATVELERVLADLGQAASDAAGAAVDPLLGAAVVLVDDPAGGRLALAEPVTEGRLAATLARHGEGPCGRYLGLPASSPADALEAFRRRAATAGVAVSRVEAGPFGSSVLVLSGSVTGPHLIVADHRPVPSRS